MLLSKLTSFECLFYTSEVINCFMGFHIIGVLVILCDLVSRSYISTTVFIITTELCLYLYLYSAPEVSLDDIRLWKKIRKYYKAMGRITRIRYLILGKTYILEPEITSS